MSYTNFIVCEKDQSLNKSTFSGNICECDPAEEELHDLFEMEDSALEQLIITLDSF